MAIIRAFDLLLAPPYRQGKAMADKCSECGTDLNVMKFLDTWLCKQCAWLGLHDEPEPPPVESPDYPKWAMAEAKRRGDSEYYSNMNKRRKSHKGWPKGKLRKPRSVTTEL